MEVDLFVPCFIDQLYPQTAFNVVKILEKAGLKVHYNPNQTCCGQASYNSGFWSETRDVATKFLHDFSSGRPVISPSASCTGFVRNYYPDLFKGSKHENECKDLHNRFFEFTDFLVNHLNFTDFGATFEAKVTCHDACAALREYGIKEEPRKLLSNVKGLELVEMPEIGRAHV